MQTTLAGRARIAGVGVHCGRTVALTLNPAEAGNGVSFSRSDLDDAAGRRIRADFRHVSATDQCTAVGVGGASVATVEHLLAALSVLGVDNAVIEVDGPEVPVMDGSADPFVEAIDRVGVVRLDAPRRFIKVLRPVRVARGESVAEFRPHRRLRIEIEIDFANALIGRQAFAADLDAATFRRDVARARTFGFLTDVEGLWARGLALGASLDNAVVVGEDRVVNPEGLRFDDEFVRHKALDALGDLALIGAPLIGCYRSYRGGHWLNIEAVEALMADETAWTYVEAPARRKGAHAGLAAGVGVAVYSPDNS
ncbi:MAG: UDP-3-O-acyl-N-acetylglucosamine deacetylase [Bauldia sp.]